MSVNDRHEDELADALVRRDLVYENGISHFVEAGAGSGKTTILVARIVELLRGSTVTLDRVAAITFTERAALELRDRLGNVLQREIANPSTSAEERSRFEQALTDLDLAPIGTLHSFAQRILRSFTSECGLPPVFRVTDPIEASEIEAEGWLAFTTTIAGESDLALPLQRLAAFGIGLGHWREMAAALERDRHRLPQYHSVVVGGGTYDLVGATVAALNELVTVITFGVENYPGVDEGDGLLVQLRERRAQIELAQEELQGGTESDVVDFLASVLDSTSVFVARNKGRKGNWGPLKSTVIAEVLDRWTYVVDLARAVVFEDLAILRARMIALALERSNERKRRGVVSFDDLLTIALDLLRDPATGGRCRQSLHERYPVIMVDEFQDTDPVQVELLWLISSPLGSLTALDGDRGGPSDGVTEGQISWSELSPAPGSLFMVGDPQQSIYRFRRADLHLYSSVREMLGAGLGQVKALTTNFRSTGSIVEFNNRCFAHLFESLGKKWGTLDPLRTLTLSATADIEPSGPAVAVIGADVLTLGDLATLKKRRGKTAENGSEEAAEERESSTGILSLYEAMVIADTIEEALWSERPWSVRSGENESRPARLSDIAILLPRHRAARLVEEQLVERGIAVRSDRSSSVYELLEIQELIVTLRAISDPTDSLSVVSALRSSLFGCTDAGLLVYAQSHESWVVDEIIQADHGVPSDVAEALSALVIFRRAARHLSPSRVIEMVLDERRVLELSTGDLRFRDVLAAVRYLVEEARSWFESTGGTFREYVDYLSRRAQGGARTSEAVISDLDDDAVTVMTIHAAKGLEFPIVFVGGQAGLQRPRVELYRHFLDEDQLEYRVAGFQSDGFDERNGRELAELEAELARLLYVACTRAKDHLVLSLVRDGDDGETPSSSQGTPKPAKSLSRLMSSSVRAAGQFRSLRLEDAPAVPAERSVARENRVTMRSRQSFAEWTACHGRLVALFETTERSSVSDLLDAMTVRSSVVTSRSANSKEESPAITASPGRESEPKSAVVYGKPPRGGAGRSSQDRNLRSDELGSMVHSLLRRLDFGVPLGGLQRRSRSLLEEDMWPSSTRELVGAIVDQVLSSALIPLVSGTRCLSEVPLFATLPSGSTELDVYGSGSQENPRATDETVSRSARLLEGVIDLLSIDERRIMIVDFKTTATEGPIDLDRLEGRRERAVDQCILYGWAMQAGGGVAVDDAVVVYASPTHSTLDRVEHFAQRVQEIKW